MDWETKIEDKIDKISDKIEVINITMAKQEMNIEEHIRRTAIAEENLSILKNELKPIQAHVNRVEGVVKVLGLVAASIGLMAALTEILTYFK